MTEAEHLMQRWHAARRPSHPGGRPGGRFNPNIDWLLAEKLFVEGELVGEAEHVERVYSSARVIAKRVGTTKENIHQRVMRYNWREKRRLFQYANGVISADRPDVVDSNGQPVARRAPRRDPEAILLAYVELFAEAVERRTIRYDSIADLDKAIRLLAYVRGQAESSKHVHVSVSLEAMQKRHRELRAHVATRVDDDVAGVIGGGAVLDAVGEAIADEDAAEAQVAE